MFPLRDTIRAHTFPIVNYSLIAVNVLIFFFESNLEPGGFDRLVSTLGLVPRQLSMARPFSFFTLFSSMFLHGGWFHLISNMWMLFIFGDNVEDRMGSFRYLAFYLLGGTVAGLTHALVTVTFFGAESQPAGIPTVGASGAIAGVLGAYIVLYPRARVTTLVPLLFLPWFIEIPAVIFLGVWFITQLSPGLLYLGQAGGFGGIAWWAHIGGFVYGLLLVSLFSYRPKVYRDWYRDEYWPW